jgi:hypothetical protein
MSEHPGTPQRPPSYAYLLIDSKDRYTTTRDQVLGNVAANNFTIQRGNALLYGYFTRLAITQVSFDWKLPTIVGGKNDTILLHNITTDVSGVVVFQEGFYTPDALAAELQSKIQAEVALGLTGMTVTFVPLNGGFLFESNGNDFAFADPTTSPVTIDSPQEQQIILRTYATIGVTNANLDLPSFIPTPDQALAPPNMIYTRYVDIVSKELTKYQSVKDNDTSPQNQLSQVVVRLYTTPPNTYIPTGVVPGAGTETDPSVSLGDRPFTLCVDYNTPKHIKWEPYEAVYNVDLAVFDEFGELLPWNNNLYPWEFNLTIVASET